jgi:PKHD-type hydroxylase
VHIVLKSVLSVNEIARVNALILSAAFIDGRATSVLGGKKNLQLPLDSEAALKAGAIIVEKLRTHDTFNLAVHPCVIHQPLFSRYEPGMEYPDHIDVAMMGGIRTDVALTLFLNARDAYDGGELVVNTGNGLHRYRLDAGDAIAYPASMVHHVAPVARGVRLAAVTWVQSLYRDPVQRDILYNLGLCMRSLDGTSCGPRLSRSYWNLVRLWAETWPCPEPT